MYFIQLVRICIPLAVHLAAQAVTAVLYREVPFFAARSQNAVLMTVTAALIALPVLIFLWRRDRAARPCCPEKNREPRAVAWWIWILIPIGGTVCSALSAVLTGLGPARVFTDAPLRRLFAAGLRLKLPGLCVIVPFVEELIFRGLTYERAREIMPKWPAILLVSAIFALYHGNMLQMLYAFPMSILLQLIYIRTGTLLGAVLFHSGANLLAVLVEAMM